MNLGIAKVAFAVALVVAIAGFAVPTVYSGLSQVGAHVDSAYMSGISTVIIGLVMAGVFIVIVVILLGVVENA